MDTILKDAKLVGFQAEDLIQQSEQLAMSCASLGAMLEELGISTVEGQKPTHNDVVRDVLEDLGLDYFDVTTGDMRNFSEKNPAFELRN